jgi:hypothetical protein
MNAQQVIKYNLLKAQLMTLSFNWIASPTYTRNGMEVYKNIEAIYAPNAGESWNLTVKSTGILCLVRGEKSITIGFLSEYNTQEHFVIALAEQVNRVAHDKILIASVFG